MQPTGDSDVTPAAAPATAALTTAQLGCPGLDQPAPAGTATSVGVASLAEPGAAGEAQTTTGGTSTPLALVPGPVAAVGTASTPVTVRAGGDLAPGLLATRAVASPLAADACRPPGSEQWFTGVGAAADHTSVLELVNTEAGPAVADVTVWSAGGPVDVPALRGLAVAPGATTRIDLGQVVPRRGDLGLRVQVTRGRMAVSVLDRLDPLTGAPVLSDWLRAPGRAGALPAAARPDPRRRGPPAQPGQPRRGRGVGRAGAGDQARHLRPRGPGTGPGGARLAERRLAGRPARRGEPARRRRPAADRDRAGERLAAPGHARPQPGRPGHPARGAHRAGAARRSRRACCSPARRRAARSPS